MAQSFSYKARKYIPRRVRRGVKVPSSPVEALTDESKSASEVELPELVLVDSDDSSDDSTDAVDEWEEDILREELDEERHKEREQEYHEAVRDGSLEETNRIVLVGGACKPETSINIVEVDGPDVNTQRSRCGQCGTCLGAEAWKANRLHTYDSVVVEGLDDPRPSHDKVEEV